MSVEFPTFTQTMLAAKKAKGLSFTDLEKLLGYDEVWIASVFYGQNTTSVETAQKLAEVLGLGEDDGDSTDFLSQQGFRADRAYRSVDLSLLRDYAGVRLSDEGYHSGKIRRWHYERDRFYARYREGGRSERRSGKGNDEW